MTTETEMQYTETEMQYTETEMQYTETEMQYTETEMQYTETEMQYTETEMQYVVRRLIVCPGNDGFNYFGPYDFEQEAVEQAKAMLGSKQIWEVKQLALPYQTI
jgi:hypothetical protein